MKESGSHLTDGETEAKVTWSSSPLRAEPGSCPPHCASLNCHVSGSELGQSLSPDSPITARCFPSPAHLSGTSGFSRFSSTKQYEAITSWGLTIPGLNHPSPHCCEASAILISTLKTKRFTWRILIICPNHTASTWHSKHLVTMLPSKTKVSHY